MILKSLQNRLVWLTKDSCMTSILCPLEITSKYKEFIIWHLNPEIEPNIYLLFLDMAHPKTQNIVCLLGGLLESHVSFIQGYFPTDKSNHVPALRRVQFPVSFILSKNLIS